MTDATSKTSYTDYDAAGQVTETIDADSNPTYYGYDAAGQQSVGDRRA